MRRNTSASKVAYPAVLGALSLVLVYIGSIAPTGNWGIIAVAGLLPSAAVISVGLQAGFLCWACVSILAFLLSLLPLFLWTSDFVCGLLFMVVD